MLTKDSLKAAGGFGKGYKTIETLIEDLCLRMRDAGLKSVYAGRSICKYSRRLTPPDDYKTIQEADKKLFSDRWGKLLQDGDIYYGNRY